MKIMTGKGFNPLFASLGHNIGSHPAVFILLSLALFGVSLFGLFFRFDVNFAIKSGYTRADAASTYEISVHKQFFNSTGEPWYMALFAIARNNGSLLGSIETDELTTFYQFVSKEMPVTFGNQSVYYNPDLCQPFCDFNSPLWNLLNYQSFFKIKYPLSIAGPYKVNIGKHVFNRTVDSDGLIQAIGTVAMYFTTFVTETGKEARLKCYEEAVLREALKHNANPNNTLDFVVHGAQTVSSEVRRGAIMAIPYYLAGAVLLIVFVLVCFVLNSVGYRRMDQSRLILGMGALLSPTLAAITALGLVLLTGFHLNILVLISPFLTLAIGIGVDDAFLLTNTWMRHRSSSLHEKRSTNEWLQLVFEEVGASMVVTSLTNVLGFGLGCIAPVPEIRIFCACVSLAMLIDLLYQLFLFAPLLVLLSGCEPQVVYKPVKIDDKSDGFEKIAAFITSCTKRYSNFLVSTWAKLSLFVLLIAYWSIASFGILNLKTNIDASMLLPPDSQNVDGVRIMNQIVWPDYLNINYMILKPPNFANPNEYTTFLAMVKEMESVSNSLGSSATMFWIKDYLRYLANPGASKLDVFFGITGPEANDSSYRIRGLDMSQFEIFINTEPYTAWKNGVRYRTNNENGTEITSMLLMIGYNGTSSLADKANLMKMCRQIAAHYSSYHMVPFDTDAELIDVILAVPLTTISSILCTIGAIFAMFLVFSMNFYASIIATASVASTCFGVIGFLQYWKCYLDPLTMVALLMSAGIAVDYTVHVIYHYVFNVDDVDDNKRSRINASLHACGLSTLQAGISTMLVMFPVLFAPIGVYTIIAKAIVLVSVIGLVHGLFIVPVCITLLPLSKMDAYRCC